MKRNFHWSAYLLALIITSLVFAVGILLGLQLSAQANEQLMQDVTTLKGQSAQLEVLTLLSQEGMGLNASNATALCTLYQKQALSLNDDTAALGGKLTLLENQRGFDDPQTISLKEDYSVLEIRDYLFVQQVNRLCNAPFSTILYFYSNKHCDRCSEQGNIVTQVKSGRPNTLVYAFDTDLNAPAISSLQQAYGITQAPALVANGRVLQGFQSAATIAQALR